MDEKGTNFALLAIVAIVAIVALVVLLKAQNQKAMPVMEGKNMAGQMIKSGGSSICGITPDGGCAGDCKPGTGTCNGKGDTCACS